MINNIKLANKQMIVQSITPEPYGNFKVVIDYHSKQQVRVYNMAFDELYYMEGDHFNVSKKSKDILVQYARENKII